MEFRRYRYVDPQALPLEDGLAEASDDEIRAAGFDPDDEEVVSTRLSEAWNGHPAGAMVVTGLLVEGHPFAVEIGPAVAQTQAQAVAVLLHEDGQNWSTDDGRTFDQLCAECVVEHRGDLDSLFRRFVFNDGSALLDAAGSWWDVEGSRPWTGAGHEEDGELGVDEL